MIKRKGDVFTTEAAYIGHGVNCKGLMGAGIARAIRNKYPKMHEHYKMMCNNHSLLPGDAWFWVDNEKTIVNLATQNYPGPDARYEAIFQSCYKAAKQISRECEGNRNPVLAIPMIGCGIGGLDWSRVEVLLSAVEILVPGFQFEVWKFE